MFSVEVFQPCAAMPGTPRPQAPPPGGKRPAADSAVADTVSKVPKVAGVVPSPGGQAPAPPASSSNVLAISAGEALVSSWPPCEVTDLKKPVLPAIDADDVGRHAMKGVILWVLQELPTFLQSCPGYDHGGSVTDPYCPTRRAPLQILQEEKRR